MRKILQILCAVLTVFININMVFVSAEEGEPTPVPTAPAEEAAEVVLNAGTGAVMDKNSGSLLFQKDADNKMDPASLTKLMTIYLACENLTMDQQLTMSDTAFNWYDHESGVMWIQNGETLTVQDCVNASMLASANDTTAMLVEAVSNDVDSFVALMNETASELGMGNTHFDNPFGTHSEENYSSAHDLCLLLQKAMGNEEFAKVFTAKRYTLPATNMQAQERVITTDSTMFKEESYAPLNGIKIGSTAEGGYSAAASGISDGTSVYAVVLGGESEDTINNDLQTVMNWTFDHFQTVTITQSQIGTKTVEVYEGRKHTADVTFSSDSDFSVMLPSSMDASSLKAEIVVENEKPSSVEEAEAQVIFTLNDEQIGSSEAVKSVEVIESKVPQFNTGRERFDLFCLIVLALFLLTRPVMKIMSGMRPPKE